MQLRLATFNLENLGIRPDEDRPETRKWLAAHCEAVREMIRRLDADAVAFQEVLDPRLLPPLLGGLGYDHVAFGAPGTSPLRLGVCSRYPLAAARSVAAGAELSVVDRKTGLEVSVRGAFSRPALQVTWDAPGLRTVLFVVHWKSKIPSYTPARRTEGEFWNSLGDAGEGRLVTEAKRLAQAVALRRAVDRILSRDPAARVAVLGDFNDVLASEGLRILCGDARACLSPSLAAQELLPCELSVPPALRFTQLYRGRPEMLDHLLISRALVPHFVEARVLNEFLRESEDGPGMALPLDPGSDHAPLVATFRA
jgi:hypothetical protein